MIRVVSRTVQLTTDAQCDLSQKLETHLQSYGDIDIIESAFNSVVGTYYDLRDAVTCYRDCKHSTLDQAPLHVHYVYVDTLVGRAREDELVAVRLASGCRLASLLSLLKLFAKVGTISGLTVVNDSTLILRFYDLGAARRARLHLRTVCGESAGLQANVSTDLVSR